MQIPERSCSSEKNETDIIEATTCPICLKLLPADHNETATWDGKKVHASCFSKIQEGLKKHED